MSPDGIFFCFALTWLQLTFGSLVGKLYNRHGVEEMYHRVRQQGSSNWEGGIYRSSTIGNGRQSRKYRVRGPIEILVPVHTILHEWLSVKSCMDSCCHLGPSLCQGALRYFDLSQWMLPFSFLSRSLSLQRILISIPANQCLLFFSFIKRWTFWLSANPCHRSLGH